MSSRDRPADPMHVTAFADAPQYFPPGHEGMRCFRLQGMEAGPSDMMWLGLSIVEPGGRITPAASPFEKLYIVGEGELEIEAGGQRSVLGRFDSCRIPPHQQRSVANRTDRPAVLILAMALAQRP